MTIQNRVCHVFNIHSHITFLVAKKTIEVKKLRPCDCVFLQTRGYSAPPSDIPVFDLIFDTFDIKTYCDEKNPQKCRDNIARLEGFFKTITGNRPFHFYLPCTQMYHAIIMITHDSCIGYSILEDGLRHYLDSSKDLAFGMQGSDNAMKTCNDGRLLNFGRQRPFCMMNHPKFDRVYVISENAIPYASSKTIVGSPFVDETCEECEGADAILILTNLQHAYQLDMGLFLQTLQCLIDKEFQSKKYKKIAYKLKWVANQDSMNFAIWELLKKQTGIHFVEIPEHHVVENIIHKYRIPVYSEYSSLVFYAGAYLNVEGYCFAPLYAQYDPRLTRIEAYNDYISIFSERCNMIDKESLEKSNRARNPDMTSTMEQNGHLSWKPYSLHRDKPHVLENDIHIAIVADDNYLPHACTLIESVLASSRTGVRHHFHLIHGQPYTNECQKKLERYAKKRNLDLRQHLIDKTRFDSMRLPIAHITQAMYYRFLLPSILPSSVSKVLYLDCDMIAVDDLSELYSTAVDSTYAAVVMQQQTRWCVPSNGGYFNSGMILMNLSKMREDKIEAKLFDFEANNRDKLQAPDQDVLNAVFRGNVLWMPFRWNMMTFNDKGCGHFLNVIEKTRICGANEFLADLDSPAIIHFNCEKKPWNSWLNHSEFYWHHSQKTPFYDAKLHRSLAPPAHSTNMKNKMIRVLGLPFDLTFRMTKKTLKFFLRPLKSLAQKLVHVACDEQIRILHDVFKEQRMFAKGNKNWSESILREMRNATVEQTKLLDRVFNEQRRFAQSNKERVETILWQLCEIREELADRSEIETRMKFLLDKIGQNRDLSGMLAEMRRQTEKGFSKLDEKQKLLATLLADNRASFDMLGNRLEAFEAHRKEDREFAASTTETLSGRLDEITSFWIQSEKELQVRFDELKKAVAERGEDEFAVRLLEAEKRFELERQYEMEKTLAEHEEMKNKNFEERLEAENKAYYQKRLKEDFPSLSSGHTAGFMKRQNKPFIFIAGAAFSGTSIMNTVLGQHPEVYPFRTFVLSGKETTNGESCLFDANRNPNMPEHEIIRHLDEVVQKAKGKKIVLEKVADNLFYLGRINTFVPHSKYVCMLRDGRDLIASFLCLDGSTEKNCQLRINYWLNAIDHMEKYMRIAKNMKMVRLEDFTTDPHGTLHGILDFAELDHSPEIVDYMLRYHERVDRTDIPKDRVLTGSITEGGRTQRIHSIRDIQTKQPLYKDTSRWRRDLPVELWPLVYEKIGPALERYGYVENAEQSLKEELERYHQEMESAREMEFQLEEKRRELGLIHENSVSENAA